MHLDKYIIYGDLFEKHFYPFWKGLKLEKTGRENIDWVVNLKNDKAAMNTLKDKLRYYYPARKYNAVIILPSGAELNKKSQWDEIFNALCKIRTIDLDCNIFLRFRKEKDLNGYGHLRRFKDLPKLDGRIFIDHDNFTTYELMVLSNLVITNSASFAVHEAIVTDAKVFTFELIGFTHYYFPNYGNDFILYTEEDLIRVFMGLENDFMEFDCNWDKLKKDCNYNYDGKNHMRIQEVVWNTVKEVKESLSEESL
ncbi:MAG: hypothetical protein JRI72_06350 [Deltaproteobacteria bacterium]|nr:hypothetical protein [Deltaproteobacteria bacterium]